MSLVRGNRLAIPTVALSAAALTAAPVLNAAADTAPPTGTPATVSADVLPTWQVNGVVWSMTTVRNITYAVGRFTRARPPGVAAGGSGEVVRNNILAFDITTGNLVTSFNHSLNGQALRVAASPDGSRIYVGGDFTQVDGQTRNRVAAFNTSTGALDPNFKPAVTGRVSGIAVSDSAVYLGGNFFGVNSQPRTRLAAVSRSNGSLLPWRPVADDDEVHALALAGNRVIIGGRFQKLNGATKVGIGAVDATTGASVTWTSRPLPTRIGDRYSWVTDLTVAGSTVYGSANGNGGHVFDGRFAANAANGDLIWLDNCYGATYGVHAIGQVLYSVSHAHDCSSVGGWPETSPQTFQRALAETTYATGTDKTPPGWNSNYRNQPIPTLLHWFPNVAMGTYTGQYQGAWTVTGNGGQFIALGGEFPRVNGRAQQGLVRFRTRALAPNKMGPEQLSTLKPTLTRVAGGVRVDWKTTWDRDNTQLKYEVLRGSTVRNTLFASTRFWYLPARSFTDANPPSGTQTYRIRVTDPLGNVYNSPTTSITIP